MCGASRGEVLASRWGDLDGKQATIRRSLEELDDGSLRFKPTKTKRSQRPVILPAFVIEILDQHKAQQAKDRLRAGQHWAHNGLICADPLGRPLSPRRLTKAFIKLRKPLGFNGVRLHDLRHGFATLHLMKLRTDVKVVSEALGHSDVATTFRIFSHVLPGMQEEAASQIDTLLRTNLERGPTDPG